jgi:hypothetical protein
MTANTFIQRVTQTGGFPSGQAVYSSDAPDHFYLASAFIDPFGNESKIKYDKYDLLLKDTIDAVGNIVRADNDYRVLQPVSVTDINGNRSEVALDALGMVVGTAVMGKTTENKGDSLEGFQANLNHATILAHVQDPFTNPDDILQRATTRVVYDLEQYSRTSNAADPVPNVVYVLTRETHDADLGPNDSTIIQHAFSYSDGYGREIQRKSAGRTWPIGRWWTHY